MAISRPTQFPLGTNILSPIIISPPDGLPATDEMEATLADLTALKQKSLERAKKATDDCRLVEIGLRRLKELEKAKMKAAAAPHIVSPDKVKRERDFTPLPEAISPPHSARPHQIAVGQSSSARSSVVDLTDKKKKKKRKRDDESDAESERPRKSSPPPPPPPPMKAQKTSTGSISHSKPLIPPAPDFAVIDPYPTIPPPPIYGPPPIPGPSKPTEVTEDFSKAKAPAQTVVTTFFTSIEPWIRNLREEDVGWLEWTGDEVEPFVIPKLGRWYKDVWDESDAAIYGGPIPSTSTDTTAHPQSFRAPVPTWDPSTLSEADVCSEDLGHGPLTERLISAFVPIPASDNAWKGVKAAEDAMEGRPGGSGAAAARKERMNVAELENRVRDTMRFYGLLDISEQIDYDNKVDDPITTALRKAQAELRSVVDRNKKRKARLVELARDRLAYQEYVDLRDSLDKNISNVYNRLQKRDMPKPAKKKKKLTGAAATSAALAAANAAALSGDGYVINANGHDEPSAPLPCPASLGFTLDDDYSLLVSENLNSLVKTRRQWVDRVGSVFDEKHAAELPKHSVFGETESKPSPASKMEVDDA